MSWILNKTNQNEKDFLVVTLLWSVFATSPAAWGARLTATQALERLASAGIGYYAPGRAADNLNLTATVGNLYVFSSERGYVINGVKTFVE